MTIEQADKPLVGYSIQFATPCGTSSYVREYVQSFHNTACVLIELGAKIDWAEFPGCADLSLARAKLFGNFLRSSHTHLMMIDDDMIWSYDDVVRLLLAKKDFVGAAGPKKTAKLEFAANNCTAEGALLPLITEPETGLVQVTEVGAAFMLMSRHCAQVMADFYQDLAFDGDDGVTEYALYDPILVGTHPKRRHLSEDFAFCHRWTALEGKIWLLPDIKLGHVGRAVWEGSLTQALQGTPINA